MDWFINSKYNITTWLEEESFSQNIKDKIKRLEEEIQENKEGIPKITLITNVFIYIPLEAICLLMYNESTVKEDDTKNASSTACNKSTHNNNI